MRRLFLLGCLSAACGEGELVMYRFEPPPSPAPQTFDGDPANRAVYAADVGADAGAISQAEMDCLWESGVRHLVVDTRVEALARQQLQMGFLRGFTLDVVLPLAFTADVREQVREQLRHVQGFSIGRVWLAARAPPPAFVTPTVTLFRLGEAVDECARQGTGCGVFTDATFWRTYTEGTDRYADVPLWYPVHDDARLLWAWSSDGFGGWAMPAAKQWGAGPLCGLDVGLDTMQRLYSQVMTVDRTPPPEPSTAPAAPGGLWPNDGAQLPPDPLKLMVETVPHATAYDHALERWTGATWTPYVTWRTLAPFVHVPPPLPGRRFRYRARVENMRGWGPFSDYDAFELVEPAVDAGIPDAGAPFVDAGMPYVDAGMPYVDAGAPYVDAGAPYVDAGAPYVDAGAPYVDAGAPFHDAGAPFVDAGAPPIDAGAPHVDAGAVADGGALPIVLSPNLDQLVLVDDAVVLTVRNLPGTAYELTVETQADAGTWNPYFVYSTAGPSKTFYPQLPRRYRWRARAQQNGAWSPPTANATFVAQ